MDARARLYTFFVCARARVSYALLFAMPQPPAKSAGGTCASGHSLLSPPLPASKRKCCRARVFAPPSFA